MLSKTRSDLILRPYTPGWRPHDARRRAGGASAALAVHMIALTALLWGGLRAVPPPSSASDRVVTSFAVPQAVPQPRPEQVPPGPRQHVSQASRAAAATPAPMAPPPVTSAVMDATPAPAPSSATQATAASSASRQVERTTAPPVMVAPPAPTSAARENIAAQAQAAKADWQARVLGHLRQYRRYPRAAESAAQQGIATLAITLDRQGRVLEVALRHGSGYALLDAEALATARRASPLPAPDAQVPGDPLRIEVPIDFSLRGRRLT